MSRALQVTALLNRTAVLRSLRYKRFAHLKHPLTTIALFSAFSTSPAWASPQDDAKEDPTFKVDVSLVHVLATVKGPNGAPIGDLERDEFTVTDGGEERDIVVFERQTNRPLWVAMMLDTSLSTGKEIQFEKDSAKRFRREPARRRPLRRRPPRRFPFLRFRRAGSRVYEQEKADSASTRFDSSR